jgi:hypothetical protein
MQKDQKRVNKQDVPLFYRQCCGKRAYPSKKIALARLKVLQIMSLSCYKCTFCKKWHVGTSSKPVDKYHRV